MLTIDYFIDVMFHIEIFITKKTITHVTENLELNSEFKALIIKTITHKYYITWYHYDTVFTFHPFQVYSNNGHSHHVRRHLIPDQSPRSGGAF